MNSRLHCRPRASTFVTDLITRRAFEARAVDLDLLVRDAPAVIRSAAMPRGEASHPYRLDRPIGWAPTISPALPSDFHPILADVGYDEVGTRKLHLGPKVTIAPDAARGVAAVVVDAVWPDTLLAGMVGRPLSDVVGHAVLTDPRLVIQEAGTLAGRVRLEVSNPVVSLADRRSVRSGGPVS